MAAEDRALLDVPPEIVARIQKCMTLEQGAAYVEEAAAATLAVQRLLAAYHLTREDIIARSIVEHDLPDPVRRGWRLLLLGLLARALGCRLVTIVGTPIAEPGFRRVRLIGEASNAHSVWVSFTSYEALIRRLRREAWRAYAAELTDPIAGAHPVLTEPGARREWFASFAMGALVQLEARLRGEEPVDPDAPAGLAGLLRVCEFRDRQLAVVDAWLAQRGYRMQPASDDPTLRLRPGAMRHGRRAAL